MYRVEVIFLAAAPNTYQLCSASAFVEFPTKSDMEAGIDRILARGLRQRDAIIAPSAILKIVLPTEPDEGGGT